MRRAEMRFLQLLDEGFDWILSQAAAGIEKAWEFEVGNQDVATRP